MRILYMGNKVRGKICLETLLKHGENIVGVVVPTKHQSCLKKFAEQKGLKVFQPKEVNSPNFISKVRELNLDLIIMAGYNQILKQDIIKLPKEGVLNLHGGKLPEYRGSSTLNWMIINGETEGGVSIILVDENIDTGKIVCQQKFKIEITDTINDVVKKANSIFPEMLIETLQNIKNRTLEGTNQELEEGTYYHSRYPRDGRIYWHKYSAKKVYNLVRALTFPYPGAFTYYKGQKLFIWKASLINEKICGVPGRVCRRHRNGVVVVASDKGLLLETVQLEGRKKCKANDFFNNIGVNLK